ncbi:cyclic AMP-dependent transcription factor ATF-3-like isoform X2 [Ptychodera flava]|uniref:cyclic AMP-dependent transcription factor ATF-3-like isoform X2 n=1 Tax=Ptychodera flava TaxID=63121 RepID=UPI00396A65AA
MGEPQKQENIMTRARPDGENCGDERPSAAMILLQACGSDADCVQTEQVYQDGDLAVLGVANEKSETSLTAVLKEEIKYTIQTKRLARGLSELKVEQPAPKREKLSPEEEQKRHERRERNRLAATKCRNKKRDHMLTLEKETHKLEVQKEFLLDQVEKLQREKEELTFLLDAHLIQCTRTNNVACTPQCSRDC